MRLGFYVLRLGLALVATMPIAEALNAQGYPARPITLIAPWPAGGAIDALCRALGPKLAQRLGQPVVIENRPGAASTIGVAAAGRATPDGYTLVMAGSGSLAIAPTAFNKLPYDPTKDFAPLGLIATIPFVLVVHPSLPVKSVADLVKYAKEKPVLRSTALTAPNPSGKRAGARGLIA
jgi:tripartite-type tricarboxylate transporter receptor subunit TctC